MFIDIIKAYWKESVAYRVEFMLSVLTVPVRFLILIMIWSAVYTQTDSIQGYTLTSMITYFIITAIIFMFTYDTVSGELSNEIRSGDFIIYMLHPINYIWLAFLKKVASRMFAVAVEIIPIMIILFVFFRKYFVMGNIFPFIVSLILAFIISYLIYLTVGIIAFWLIETQKLSWLVSFIIQLTSGAFFPLDLFPKSMQNFMSYLPFQYITYVPAGIYLGKHAAISILYQFLWCVGLFIFALFLWKRAIKRFTGVGA